MIECYAVYFTGLCLLIGSLEREEDDDEISSKLRLQGYRTDRYYGTLDLLDGI